MKISDIPVIHFGQNIGKASIDEDGVIELDLQTPEGEQFGDDLKKAIDKGFATGIEIRPIIPPSEPARVNLDHNPNKYSRFSRSNAPQGYQIGNGNVQSNNWS